jgi:hypothetical protein
LIGLTAQEPGKFFELLAEFTKGFFYFFDCGIFFALMVL